MKYNDEVCSLVKHLSTSYFKSPSLVEKYQVEWGERKTVVPYHAGLGDKELVQYDVVWVMLRC